jgi:hypothetical protein
MIRNATAPILKLNGKVIAIADKTSTNPKHPDKPWFNDDCKVDIKNRKRAETTIRKTSYIGQSRQFPHLQGES